MSHHWQEACKREEESRNVNQMQSEKFAMAAHVLNIIGCLQCAGFLLDPGRRVLCLNPIAAERLGDGLMLRGNRLVAIDRESDAQLERSVELTLSPAKTREGPATWLEIRRTASVPLLIRILRLGESVRPALNGASLLLVAFDPEIRQAPPADMLMRMFALTRAEAEVAIRIGCGKRVAEIAADRSVKVETVRSHSKMVFAKTRTHSQAELAALLSRLAFLVPYRKAGIAQSTALTDLPIFR
jgi:DNA-binding CsgD family transcriptional regulator